MKDRMKKVAEYFVRELVENKRAVSVSVEETEDVIIMKIQLDPKDRGAVIGVHGRRIKALKEIVHMEGFKTGKKIRLEVV